MKFIPSKGIVSNEKVFKSKRIENRPPILVQSEELPLTVGFVETLSNEPEPVYDRNEVLLSAATQIMRQVEEMLKDLPKIIEKVLVEKLEQFKTLPKPMEEMKPAEFSPRRKKFSVE